MRNFYNAAVCLSIATKVIILYFVIIFMVGCSINQEVTHLKDYKPTNICVVKHEAVKEGILDTIHEGLKKNGISVRTIDGTYVMSHSLWQPSWQKAQAEECDALCFYVANWRWDLALYMYYANIWITSPDGQNRLAQATYDASYGGGRLDKFINAHDKILELVDEMVTGKKKPRISEDTTALLEKR